MVGRNELQRIAKDPHNPQRLEDAVWFGKSHV